MTAAMIAEKLGGAEILKSQVRSDLDLAALIHGGLPTESLDAVVSAGLLDNSEAHEIVIPRWRLARLKARRQALTPEQSNRLTRVACVILRAGQALGSSDKATRWMRKHNRSLGGRRPLDLLQSAVGARLVERVLGRIEHGVYS